MALALFLSTMLAVSSQPAAARPPAEGPPIIITGKKLEDTEAALRACLERKCPPDEDIDASLAHAENLFVAGDHHKARTILRRSLDRNRKHAAAYPVPVSDLYRANGVVANHLGFEEDYERSSWGALTALKKGIAEADHRHLGARMEIARMTARTDGLEEGVRAYASVARDAEKAGRPDIAALARLRGAAMADRVRRSDSNRRRILAIASLTAPETRYAALMAKLYLARLAAEAGKISEAEALVREVAGTGFEAPVLVYAPLYQLNVQEIGNNPLELSAAAGSPARRYGGNFDDMWIDVGFWVQPHGKVSDLEVLRKSGGASWAAPLLKSIRGRLYGPLAKPSYRVERYTYTSSWEMQGGSHIRRRSPKARVEYLDLTARETAPPS